MRTRHESGLDDLLADKNLKNPIVIMGGGPSGLSTALAALSKGYDVLLVTEYPYSVRTQNVFVKDKEARKILLSHVDPNNADDVRFRDKFIKNDGILAIQEVENFLLRKLKEFPNKTNHFIHLDRRVAKLTEIDPSSSTVTLTDINQNQHTIPYLHIVDATGNKREAFRLVHSKTADDISEPLVRLPHEAQGTATFHLDKEVIEKKYPKLQNKSGYTYKLNFKEEDIKELQLKFGWNHDRAPQVYIFANRAHTRLYVGGEIPGFYTKIRLFDEANNRDIKAENALRREQIEAWCKHMVCKRFAIDPNDLYIKGDEAQPAEFQKQKEKFQKRHHLDGPLAEEAAKKQHQLSVTGFDLTLSRLKNPVQRLSANNQHWLVAVGDALQSPHFHLSHGISDGLTTGQQFAECLPPRDSDNLFNAEKFADYVHDLRNLHKRTMTGMRGSFFIPVQEKYDLDDLIMEGADEKIDKILSKSREEISEEDLEVVQNYKEQVVARMDKNNPEEETRLIHLLDRCSDTMEFIQNALLEKSSNKDIKM
ncbi:Uncharacterised protein [Legionella beliardensis]|uniref:FAD/NAD(P)-binding domain-containing protein n=1 Tax=Legionella beliardensis TaxID=91822 RepID=A0A378I494_9GAMM|nr:FAD-dependent oxidoreductase [Legionella beliardensis]STX29511.1 Uncharacterised protein [Legionella beliardensis]